MMGLDPMTIGYIRIADAHGLEIGRRENIGVTGEMDLVDQKLSASVGHQRASRVGIAIWPGALKPLNKRFFQTPLLRGGAAKSEAYHDCNRWPGADKKVFAWWLGNTEGRTVFQHHQSESLLRQGKN